MYKYAIIAAAALFTFQQSIAAETCDRYTTSYDRTYCFSKLFVESDKELNDVYKSLRKHLSTQARQNLKNTQLEWLQYRNKSCETNPGTINVDCNYRVNKERTEYLRDRLRECKSGMCNTDLATSKSW